MNRYADLPGARAAEEDGRKAVNRRQHGAAAVARAGAEERRHRIVEGMKDRLGPRPAVGFRQADIPGNRGPLADLGYEGRDVRAAVAVADEPRIALHEERRVEYPGERHRHRPCADVPGDVAGAVLLRKTERAERPRHAAPGMLANQDEIGAPLRPQHLQGMRLVGREQGPGSTLQGGKVTGGSLSRTSYQIVQIGRKSVALPFVTPRASAARWAGRPRSFWNGDGTELKNVQ